MFTPAKTGIAVVLTLIVLATISPLAIFLIEISQDPNILSITDFNIKQLEGNQLELTITISYSGSVPLKDFTLRILNETIKYGDIARGNYTGRIIISSDRLHGQELKIEEYSFKIAGLYRLSIREW